MAWEVRNGLNIKDGIFYLEPIKSAKFDRDSYELAAIILSDRLERYRAEGPPLLVPLHRGGTRAFQVMSGAFRSVLNSQERYQSIQVWRYHPSEIGVTGGVNINENDIRQALEAMQQHNEGIIIDDVFDEGETTETIWKRLSETGKSVIIATVYRKPERRKVQLDADYWVKNYYSKTVGGVTYPPWLVFPWERDDHPEHGLWQELFPEFASVDELFLERR